MIKDKYDQILAREIDPAFKKRAEIIFSGLKLKNKSQRVLDLGCGRGFYTNNVARIYPGVQVWGVDKSEKYLNQARQAEIKNVIWQIGDAQKLRFKDRFFDRVICSEVLEHIDDDEKVILEIRRVLKKGGIAIFTVPNKDYPFFWDPLNWMLERGGKTHIPAHIWWLAGIWADHVRLYDENDLVNKLTKADFTIKRLYRITRWALPFSHFLLYGIGKNLVEKGFVRSANRFNYDVKPGLLMKAVKLIFDTYDKLNEIWPPQINRPNVNLAVIAGKK